jgi:hypothetical protein
MWELATTCSKWNQSPSQRLKTAEQYGEWWAYQLDSAVSYLAAVIDSALHERDEINMGSGKKSIPRYSLSQLLDDDFRLPSRAEREAATMDNLMGVDGLPFDRVGS